MLSAKHCKNEVGCLDATCDVQEVLIGAFLGDGGVLYTGGGASINHGIEQYNAQFCILGTLTVDTARDFQVYLVNRIKETIDQDKQIRPYLCEWPFPTKRINVGITVLDENGNLQTGGDVTSVICYKNKIKYSSAKKYTCQPQPCCCNGKNIADMTPYEDLKFVNLKEESYRDACRIVQKKWPEVFNKTKSTR